MANPFFFQGPRPHRHPMQRHPQPITHLPQNPAASHHSMDLPPDHKEPVSHSCSESPPKPETNHNASGILHLQGLLSGLDRDTLLILALLLLLSKEGTDHKLLLALAYIIL